MVWIHRAVAWIDVNIEVSREAIVYKDKGACLQFFQAIRDIEKKKAMELQEVSIGEKLSPTQCFF